MICLRCQKIIDKKKALRHPRRPKRLYCPKCKRRIFDFGHEPARISTKGRKKQFDKSSYPQEDISIIPFYDKNIIDTKILECKDTLNINPDDLNTRVTLSRLYLSNNQKTLALSEIKRVLNKLDSFDQAIYTIASEIFAHCEDYKNAAKCCVLILKNNPENTTIRFNLGIALFHMNNYSVAANQFYKILKIDPKNQEAKEALKYTKKYKV